MGKHLARMVGVALICLACAPLAAAQESSASGGIDVHLQIDDVVESYSTGATSLTFLLRDISFGYEVAATGRGVLGSQKFNLPRQTVDQAITVGKEPRGIVIAKGGDDQPVLRIRIAGQKQDVLVKAKFIRSDWQMLQNGRSITIIAPVDDMQILRGLVGLIGKSVTSEVRAHLNDAPTSNIEDLSLGNMRTEGDQVIIQGNKTGFTISYPSVAASYNADVKAAP